MNARARRFDVVTFDCYGTLVDWERGIAEAFAGRADALELAAPDPRAVLAAYHEVEPELERGEYRPYRDVLARAAEGVAHHLGWGAVDGSFLAESLSSWPLFPDTNPALERLAAAGVRLGILSNVDEDLLAGTQARFTSGFEIVVTAEQVRSYKPAPAHFAEARRRIGPDARWLHAAQSYFHDVVAAKSLGIPVAWINRKGEPKGAAGPPDFEYPDLAALAASF